MATLSEDPNRSIDRFADDDSRWQALVDRNPAADGAFVYAVTTTGVYCRPTCPARRARRTNVRFHPTSEDAAAAGFRPCRRCEPDGDGTAARHADAVARAVRAIEDADEIPSLDQLAGSAGMSRHHFHRSRSQGFVIVRWLGMLKSW